MTNPTDQLTELMKDDEFARSLAQQAEALAVGELRQICEHIGYGRVVELAERWLDEKHPGWLKARRSAMASKAEE